MVPIQLGVAKGWKISPKIIIHEDLNREQLSINCFFCVCKSTFTKKFFLVVLLLFDCFLFFLVPLLKPDRLPLRLYFLYGVFLASSLCAVFFFCFLSLSSPSFVLPDIVNFLNLLMQTLGPLKGLFEVPSRSSGPLFAADSLSAPVRM